MPATASSATPLPRAGMIAAGALMALAAIAQGVSYWPGIMTWDALNQFGQAVENQYDDWHPPIMAWIWRRLFVFERGPAPMYLLQLAAYWIAYALIVAAAFRRRQPMAAWLAVIVALLPFPLALLGSVLKDCLMQGALLIAVGLLAWSGRERGWPARLAMWACLLFAATLRFNAFLAALPIALAAMPFAWTRTWARMGLAALGATALLVGAMPVVNRAIGAEHSDVEWSLAIFDLAGITKHSGVDMFPFMHMADAVAVVDRCYKPDKWDYFSSWATPLCPLTFDKLDAIVSERGIKAYPTLLQAALTHPIAYAEHRLTHFNINTRFVTHTEVQGPVPDRATENEYHFRVPPNPGLTLFSEAARGSIHSPLGWPIVWIALAAGLVLLVGLMPSAALTMPLAWSGLLYGLGYLTFSVSSELRYNLWTMTATALAGAFVLADVRAGARLPRSRVIACLAPAVAVAALCTLWRLT